MGLGRTSSAGQRKESLERVRDEAPAGHTAEGWVDGGKGGDRGLKTQKRINFARRYNEFRKKPRKAKCW